MVEWYHGNGEGAFFAPHAGPWWSGWPCSSVHRSSHTGRLMRTLAFLLCCPIPFLSMDEEDGALHCWFGFWPIFQKTVLMYFFISRLPVSPTLFSSWHRSSTHFLLYYWAHLVQTILQQLKKTLMQTTCRLQWPELRRNKLCETNLTWVCSKSIFQKPKISKEIRQTEDSKL